MKRQQLHATRTPTDHRSPAASCPTEGVTIQGLDAPLRRDVHPAMTRVLMAIACPRVQWGQRQGLALGTRKDARRRSGAERACIQAPR